MQYHKTPYQTQHPQSIQYQNPQPQQQIQYANNQQLQPLDAGFPPMAPMMGISDTIEDPFSMQGFGFGNMGNLDINQIEQQMKSRFQTAINEMNQMSQMEGMGPNSMDGNQLISQTLGSGLGQGGSLMMMQMSGMPGKGTMISKQLCSKIDYRGGKPHEEKYQSQCISQIGQDGHKISEKQEAYKNTLTGIQQAANQRILDDRGIKEIRKRDINSGSQEQHNVLKGIAEADIPTFNNQYNQYRDQIHFQDNYKYLNQFNQLPSTAMNQARQMIGQGNNVQHQYNNPQIQGALPSANMYQQGY